MLIVMRHDASRKQVDEVIGVVESRGCKARSIPGGDRVSIAVLFNKGALDEAWFQDLPGVKQAIAVTRPYKLVSRETKPDGTIIQVGNVTIGDGRMVIMAGPCAVESESRAMAIAESVKQAGADIFRGGAFKPRTSPYSFQGLGEEGLKILAKVRETFDMPVITEVMDLACFDMVEEYADIIQIGTRNMQNFSLLRRAGEAKKPVFLKRGMSATHDLSAVPVVQKESHLPIMVDPSHAAGYRDQVIPLARAAAAASAHGIMIEVHNEPKKASSDGAQSLYPKQFESLCRQIRAIEKILKETGES
jgi:3-deoxy-7-phosphoheptulonate synthase